MRVDSAKFLDDSRRTNIFSDSSLLPRNRESSFMNPLSKGGNDYKIIESLWGLDIKSKLPGKGKTREQAPVFQLCKGIDARLHYKTLRCYPNLERRACEYTVYLLERITWIGYI